MTQKEIKGLLHNCFILSVLEFKRHAEDNRAFDWDESEQKIINFVLSEYKKEKITLKRGADAKH